jgi:diaminopimelate epimerase
MRFTKMHGLGNDYVYVDCFAQTVVGAPDLARQVADRHRGIGSDGLILICPSHVADVRMEMYNADGSRGQMCGNGIRCVGKYAYEHDLSRTNPLRVETDTGVLDLQLTVSAGRVTGVRVDMGRPDLHPRTMPARLPGERVVEHPLQAGGRTYAVTLVSMGNPHVVIAASLGDVDLQSAGPALECHPAFPQRINVHFMEPLSRREVRMITWERGSGATQACGTGACAVAVAGALTGRLDRRCTVHLPGGELQIEWADDDHVFMTGPAVEVFSGVWEPK